MRPRLRQVAGHRDAHLLRLAARRVVHVDPAELLVDQRVRSRRKRLEIEARVLDFLLHGLRRGVVREQRHRAVTVGQEVHLVLEPHRIRIIGVVSGHLRQRQILQSHDVDGRRLASAVPLPRVLPLVVRHVRHVRPVGRILAVERPPHRKWLGDSAFQRHGVELGDVSERIPVGHEKDFPSVRRPAQRTILCRVPRQSLRLSAGRGHDEHVPVAVVIRGKRDPLPIGGENRRTLVSSRRQLPRRAAVSRNAPQISPVREDDLRLAQRRPLQQQRHVVRPRAPSSGENREHQHRQAKPNAHEFPLCDPHRGSPFRDMPS